MDCFDLGKNHLTGHYMGAIYRPDKRPLGGVMQSNNIKYSEDIVPITEMKINPGRIVNQVDKTSRPVLLTNRGRGVAIVQSLKDYEAQTEEQAFLRGVVQGLMDLEERCEVSLSDVKKRLGLAQ